MGKWLVSGWVALALLVMGMGAPAAATTEPPETDAAAVPVESMAGSKYTAVAPARLADTRPGLAPLDGQGPRTGLVGAGEGIAVQVTGRGGVPASGVGAVALNVTAVGPSANTFVTVFPAGSARPTASNLNPAAGQTVPNMVIVKVGTAGNVALYNDRGTTHLIVDVLGWFPASSDYVPIAPQRLADTRPSFAPSDGKGPRTGVVGPGQSIDVQVSGRAGLPAAGVGSVVLNVTAVGPTENTFITVFPSGSARPTASSLNPAAGQTVPNMAIVKVGPDGKVAMFNNRGATHLIADVMGWFPTTSDFAAVSPQRLADTRPGFAPSDGQGPRTGVVGPGESIELQVTGRSGVPSTGVGAVALNVTAVSPSANTFISVFPARTVRPLASNLNPVAGLTVPNMVIVRLGAGGKVSLYNDRGATHLIVDLLGWFPGTELPPQVGGAKQVSAGADHTCAIVAGGRVKCWGRNGWGQLGDGTTQGRLTPVFVSGISGAIAVDVGNTHSCAILQGGTVNCWGSNGNTRKLGDGTTVEMRRTPVTVLGVSGATAISAGPMHTCAIVSGGEVKCWGSNYNGQLGDGTSWQLASPPVKVVGILGAIDIAVGHAHSCALVAGGQVRCWGSNGTGELGHDSIRDSPTPVVVSGLAGAAAISAGHYHTCALVVGGQVRCWGSNGAGQLGDGSTKNARVPVTVVRINGAVAISAGRGHTCAVVGTQAKCWGYNDYGSLGNGETFDEYTPVDVTGLNNALTVFLGEWHSCAVIAGGQVKCWGPNGSGQLGDGSTKTRRTPVTVVDLGTVQLL